MYSKLYAHQIKGVEWLATTRRAALLDDPGLGKTITAIVAADRARAHRMLVLVPTCVLWNWAHEIEQWSPWRTVQVVSNGSTSLDKKADTIITTHGLLLNQALREQLLRRGSDVTILDESHFFRSRHAKRTIHFYNGIVGVSERTWCLTGTPMPNNAAELWTMCHGLWPHVFKEDFHHFREHYCECAWSPYGDSVKVVGNKNAPELREKLKGLILRRKKDEALDLPPVRYEQITLRPTVMPQEIRELEGELSPSVRAALSDTETVDEAFTLLGQSTAFARFRRLCGMAKAAATAELLGIELDCKALDKVVVFAHHTSVVATIAHKLHTFGVRTITGATPAAERTASVEAFQNDPRVRVIVCNIVAGGTGTTLTAARDVVFVELSFVPGENVQAADRIRRIGQTNECRVRFVALAGTIDEPLVNVLRRKTKMIREVFADPRILRTTQKDSEP